MHQKQFNLIKNWIISKKTFTKTQFCQSYQHIPKICRDNIISCLIKNKTIEKYDKMFIVNKNKLIKTTVEDLNLNANQ
jgi:hypothetical protein